MVFSFFSPVMGRFCLFLKTAPNTLDTLRWDINTDINTDIINITAMSGWFARNVNIWLYSPNWPTENPVIYYKVWNVFIRLHHSTLRKYLELSQLKKPVCQMLRRVQGKGCDQNMKYILTPHLQAIFLHPVPRKTWAEEGPGPVRAHERCWSHQDPGWGWWEPGVCGVDEASQGQAHHRAQPDGSQPGPVPDQAPPWRQDHLHGPPDLHHSWLHAVRGQWQIGIQFLLCWGPALDYNGTETQ